MCRHNPTDSIAAMEMDKPTGKARGAMPVLTDPRDGRIYRVVQIGRQCWMAENLKFLPAVCPATTTPDGSPRCFVYDYQGWNVSEAKTAASYRDYGVLYNWPAALAACPPGWHLPSDEEWSELTDFLIRTYKHINASNVGFALRSRRQVGSPLSGENDTSEHPRWERAPEDGRGVFAAVRRGVWNLVDGTATGHGADEFGFSALPGGRMTYGCFHRIGDLGYWWSSTEASPLRVWIRQMTLGGTVNRWDVNKTYGFSIRGVRDCESP
jgi:uncharacterized protein (TIGR02145 family)